LPGDPAGDLEHFSMVDSNFANSISQRQTWPPRPTTKPSPKGSPGFSRFCWGTALGVIVGAFCGAVLPDRLMGAGHFGNTDFKEVPASTMTRQHKTPTPMSELSDIQATVPQPHTWDVD
jgi:hypothetical protein